MIGLAAAQRTYDRIEPDYEVDVVPVEFSASIIEEFIKEFAESDDLDASRWLENQGVLEQPRCAELIRTLCRAWVKNNMEVYLICGSHFWNDMKNFAHEYWQEKYCS